MKSFTRIPKIRLWYREESTGDHLTFEGQNMYFIDVYIDKENYFQIAVDEDGLKLTSKGKVVNLANMENNIVKLVLLDEGYTFRREITE